MNAHPLTLCGTPLAALGTGALYLPAADLLCVSDLHLGKSERIARRSGVMLPPWEDDATLDRLAGDLETTGARAVVCLGDSFDDLAAAQSLPATTRARLLALMAGRHWVWVLGNHDPGPVDLGGSHLAQVQIQGLTFRHQAAGAERAEVSGHYHPKIALPGAGGARPCFLYDAFRLILPAYGAYTGGLSVRDPALTGLFQPPAFAILTGRRPILAPLTCG